MSLFKKLKGADAKAKSAPVTPTPASDEEAKEKVMPDNRTLYNEDSESGPPIPSDHWVDPDLLFCVNPLVNASTTTTYDQQIAIPMNTIFDFENKLFKGKAMVRAIGLPNTDKSYFKGKNRKMDWSFQGMVKRRICFDRVYTGQIFDKKFTKLPAQYLISGLVKLVKSLAPAVRADINGDTPHMITPLASAAQLFSANKPGEEPRIDQPWEEDLSLLDESFKGMGWQERKNFFHNLDNLKQYYFEPGTVYTISSYSHMISATSYTVHMLGLKLNIAQYLSSPMQIAAVILPTDDKEDIDSESASSNTNTQIGDDSQEVQETIQSEALPAESKDEDEVGDGLGDLTKCEFLYNFQLWHSKLIEHLYPEDADKDKDKKKGFKLFNKK